MTLIQQLGFTNYEQYWLSVTRNKCQVLTELKSKNKGRFIGDFHEKSRENRKKRNA